MIGAARRALIFAIMILCLQVRWWTERNMAAWGFFDWLTYGALAIGALVLAMETALAQSPNASAVLPGFLKRPFWGFVPVICVILATITFILSAIGVFPKQANTATAAPTIATTPTVPIKPNLHMQIHDVDVFTLGDVKWSGVILFVKAWNTGTPTNIVEWNLSIIQNGKSPIVAQFTVIPNELNIKGKYNPIKLTADQSLAAKTENKDIGLDTMDGALLYYTDIESSFIKDAGTILRLVAKDKFDNIFQSDFRIGDHLQR